MITGLVTFHQGLSGLGGQCHRRMRRGSTSVITIENVREFPAGARGAIVTVGNFDGVHRGHQQLLGRLRALADAAGVPALAVTFDPHPVALLRPDQAPVPLVWTERRSPCCGKPARPKSRCSTPDLGS